MSETVDLLQDVEQEIYLEPASVGQRFLNFLIDLFCIFYNNFFIWIFRRNYLGRVLCICTGIYESYS